MSAPENATGGGREVTLDDFRDAIANGAYEAVGFKNLGGGRVAVTVRRAGVRERIVVTDRPPLVAEKGAGS